MITTSASVTRNAPVTRDERDDYARRASMHRPTCMRCMELAARDLAAQGLKPADIAPALGISAEAVRALLAEREAGP